MFSSINLTFLFGGLPHSGTMLCPFVGEIKQIQMVVRLPLEGPLPGGYRLHDGSPVIVAYRGLTFAFLVGLGRLWAW